MPTSPLQSLLDRLAPQAMVAPAMSALDLLRQRVAQIPSRAVLAPVSAALPPPAQPPVPAPVPLLPQVAAIGVRPSRSSLVAGQVLAITVRFSEAVTVSGRPGLSLLLRSGSIKTSYLGGSGTNQLEFLYVVQPGDQAPSLQLQPQAPFQLQGGQIQSLITGLPAALPSLGAPLTAALASLPALDLKGGPDPALASLNGWNRLLLEAIGKAALSPALSSRALAMFNTACFDCVNAARGSIYSGYALNVRPDGWRGADLSTAFAQVASTVLGDVFAGTSQAAAITAAVSSALNARPVSAASDQGLALGQQVGDRYAALRADDRNHLGTAGYVAPTPAEASTTTPGVYVATVNGFPKGPSLPDWGRATPWIQGTLQASRPGTTPPGASAAIPTAPALDSEAYARDFQEVKLKGSVDSASRTADEAQIAQFWANGPKTETPPGHWQEIVTTIAQQKGLSLLETSRLYAAVGMALADAAIAAWAVKYDGPLWRPITAIQQADRDGNPLTIGDASWMSFIATPAFPTFPSGHSTFSAAAAAAADALVGAVDPFKVMGGDNRDIERSYTSLWQAAEESGRSRILGGIHFNFDNITGLAMGRAIGSQVVDQALMEQAWLADGGVTYRFDGLDPQARARAVQGGQGDDLIIGAADQGNRLAGGVGRDRLQGGSRSDWLSGGDGDDLLIGLGGSDWLEAGAGGARLVASSGAQAQEQDTMVCGSGVDIVVLSEANGQGLNYSTSDSHATIKGFDLVSDRIELRASDLVAHAYSLQAQGPLAISSGMASSWLYRSGDALACFEGVAISSWGLGPAGGELQADRLPSWVLLA